MNFSNGGFGDSAVFLWDLDGDGRGVRLPVQRVFTAAFNPQGDLLATGTENGRVALWSTSDGEMVARLEQGTSFISDLWFSPTVGISPANLRSTS